MLGFTLIVLACFLYGMWKEIAFMNSSQTCGRIIEQISGSRKHCYFKYSFNINDKSYEDVIACIEVKNEFSLDSLKKIQCIKIEYSLFNEATNRIVDERILK